MCVLCVIHSRQKGASYFDIDKFISASRDVDQQRRRRCEPTMNFQKIVSPLSHTKGEQVHTTVGNCAMSKLPGYAPGT